jgi:hypothetical protein
VVENLSPIEGPTGKADRWTWLAREPQQWSPHVRTTMDRVQVFFCSYCGLGKQTIYRQTDTYRRGAYRFTTERTAIVEGPKGFVHPELIQKSRSSR